MRSVIFVVAAAATMTAPVAYAQPAPTEPVPPTQGPADPGEPPPDMPINTAPATEPAPPPAASTPPAPEPSPPPAPEPEPATPAVEPAPLPSSPALVSSPNKDAAWLFVGGALTFLTAGTVLAYSTSSAEQDMKDLYTSPSGGPVVFDDATKKRYDDLNAEGRRYEVLALTSFGLAAGCAIGAAVFFVRASHETEPAITPVISPTSAGVRVRF